MPISLKSKISKLRYNGSISNEEYQDLIEKLERHDTHIRNNAIDECIELIEHEPIVDLIEELKAFRKNKTFKIGKDSHSWEVGYDKGYEQGRVDAIDECIEMIEHECFLSGTTSKVLIHHLEQLKGGGKGKGNYRQEAEQTKNDIYNEALDDFRKRINDFLNDSADFADFVVTDGAIDCVIDELKKSNFKEDEK